MIARGMQKETCPIIERKRKPAFAIYWLSKEMKEHASANENYDECHATKDLCSGSIP